MRVPLIRGIIDRRILVNYRIDADVANRFLPSPFRPRLVRGTAMAGVCLIRLTQIRPRPIPKWFGLHSENAAHRFAVVWDQGGRPGEGVFIPRRDTSSRLNVFFGGRLFPGLHHRARFIVDERNGRYSVRVASNDSRVHMLVEGREAGALSPDSIFRNVDEASEFFRCGALGFSPTTDPAVFEGLELRSLRWQAQPLNVEQVASSFFGNREAFPAGSVQFDSALLMRGIPHEWHAREPMRASSKPCAQPVTA